MAVFKPEQSSDDCYVTSNETINLTYAALYFGQGTYQYHAGIRFRNVTIPQGSTILSAVITFQANFSHASETCNAQIKGENIDTAATFSTYADYNTGRTRTAAYVDWNSIPPWTINTDYDSPSIVNIIQEIVNRGGWVSGNDLVIFISNNGSSATTYRAPKSYDTSTTLCPRLTITWQEVGGYSITASPGSYTVSGVAAGALADRLISANPGNYAITGIDAILVKGFNIIALPGEYVLTGADASLLAARLLNADPGSYAVTGVSATLARGYFISADGGVYAITGVNASLLAQRLISADIGSYLVTGAAAQILAQRLLNVEPGAYDLTGNAASLIWSGITGFPVGHIFIDPMTGEPKKFFMDVIAKSLNINPGDLLIEKDGSKVYIFVKDPVILSLN